MIIKQLENKNTIVKTKSSSMTLRVEEAMRLFKRGSKMKN